MKRIISALLILIMLIPPMVLTAEAAALTHADSVVRLTTDKTNVAVGDVVTVTVAYENIPACSSIDLCLVYDTNYLKEPANADVSSNVGGKVKEKNPAAPMDNHMSQELEGKKAVKVVAAGENNCLKAESGTLFTAKFVVKAEAPAPGIPLEFVGNFNNIYSDKDMWNTIEVVNTHISTANPTKSVTEVSLSDAPTKTQYVQGQALKMEGGHLLVKYSDNSTETVRLSLAEVTQYEFNKEGTQTVKASYAGKEVSFDIQTEKAVLSSISMGVFPDTLDYIVGKNTPIDKKGGILLLHYNGGLIKILDMNDSEVIVSGYNSSQLGNQIITVTYGGFETEYKIGVVKKAIQNIDVRTPMICETCKMEQDAVELVAQAGGANKDKASFIARQEYIKNASNNVTCLADGCNGKTFTTKMKRVYFLGDPFDGSYAKLLVTYTDGDTEELNMTSDMVEFKNMITGDQNVRVVYGSQWTLISNVVVRAKEVTKISISQLPEKTILIQGQVFDPAGGKILVKYDNGTEEELSMEHVGVSISYNSLNEVGDKKITVGYRYKQATFYIRVIAREVESIAVDPTAKSTYIQGTPLDLDTKLFVTYNDGKTETAYLRDATWSGYDAEKIGPQDVLVTYGKKDYTWKVLVEEKPIVNVRKLEIIGSLPATIVEGLDLNLENCTLTATYEDDSVEDEIPIIAPMISFNRKAGKQQVTISYKEKTVTFEIEVLKKAVEELKIEGTLPTAILEGTELNLEGCTLTATYNDGEVKKDIPITPAMVVYDKQVGEQTVTVSYDGQTATFTICIQAKTAQGIEIAVLPQISYLEGKDTALNLAGGKITVFYDNNTTALVSLTDPSVKVSGFDKNVLGKQTITVRYLDIFTDTFDVFMNEKEIVGITLAAMPSQTMYRQGVEKFDPKGGLITVFYNNDTQETLNLSEAEISGFSNLFAGNVTVTAAYEGYEVEFTVLILAESSFKDLVLGEYYETPVLWAVTKGITTGTSETTFSPEDECTRGQIVTFLWRTAGKPKPQTTKNPFKDVQKDAYYYEAVLWAVENKITTGTSKNTFSPDAACTRGQVATFLWRAKGEPAAASSKNPFKDLKNGEYYYNAVLWAVENGITNGTSETTFAPNTTCTRGHIVTFLYRTYK